MMFYPRPKNLPTCICILLGTGFVFVCLGSRHKLIEGLLLDLEEFGLGFRLGLVTYELIEGLLLELEKVQLCGLLLLLYAIAVVADVLAVGSIITSLTITLLADVALEVGRHTASNAMVRGFADVAVAVVVPRRHELDVTLVAQLQHILVCVGLSNQILTIAHRALEMARHSCFVSGLFVAHSWGCRG